jgi:hypothetical protein
MYQPLNAEGQLVLGLDRHDALVPGPARVPAMPHVVAATIGACGDGRRLARTVASEGCRVVPRDHELNGLVAHVPLGPNLTLPLVQLGSQARFLLGSRRVLVEAQPVAAGTAFVELCADPFALPTGVVCATTTVFVHVDAVDVLLAASSYVLHQVVGGVAAWGAGELWSPRVAAELRLVAVDAAARVEAVVHRVAAAARAEQALGALVVPLAEAAVACVEERAGLLVEREVGRRAAEAVAAASGRMGAHGRALAEAAAGAVEGRVRSYLVGGVIEAGVTTAALGG